MCMQVPSGNKFIPSDILLLREAHRTGSIAYRENPFRLKSKIESHVYVSLRGDLTDNPYLLSLMGRKIAETISQNMSHKDAQPNLIGLPTAGTALAIAASTASVELHSNNPKFPLIACRVMREKLKTEHGADNRWVNGTEKGDKKPDTQNFTFWTVDNVATDGETKIEQAVLLDQDGYPSKDMPQLIFADREQGAVKRLKSLGFKRVVVCYFLLDIAFAYRELGLWPNDIVDKVEAEIKAHQFS